MAKSMTKTRTHACPLARMIDDREYDIRSKLKAQWKKTTFSVDGLAKTARREMRLAASALTPAVAANAFHRGWCSIDHRERGSAACSYERMRTLIAGRGLLRKALPSNPRCFLVTRADARQAVPLEHFGEEDIDKLRRPVQTALRELGHRYRKLAAITVFELSFGRSLDGSVVAEPHFHLLIWGVPEDVLKEVFEVRGSQPKYRKPLRVKSVSNVDRALGYILKMRGELRVEYIGPTGNVRRKDNKLPSRLQSLWLSCLAHWPVKKVLTFTGFSPDLVETFYEADMRVLIEELLNRRVGVRR